MIKFFKEKGFAILLLSVVFTFSSLFWTRNTVHKQEELSGIELGWPVPFVVQDYSQLSPPQQWFANRIGLGTPQEYPASLRFLPLSFSIALNFLVIFNIVFVVIELNPRLLLLRRIVSTEYILGAVGVALLALVTFFVIFASNTRSQMGVGIPPPYIPTPQPQQPIFLEHHPSSVSPVEWKTFESQKLGFSFEYPTEWGTVAEEIIDYAGGQNQAGGYVASAGKAYLLIFSLISHVSYEYRIYGVGQSADFAAGREFIHTDYRGDPKRSAEVISDVGINLTTRCSEAGYPAGPPTSHVIKFNLPGKEINGVMLVFPVLSITDTQKYNQLIDDFMKKEISCGDMQGDKAGGEKAKQIMAKLVAKEKEISEMLRMGENFDEESHVNLRIYNRILESAKILQ